MKIGIALSKVGDYTFQKGFRELNPFFFETYMLDDRAKCGLRAVLCLILGE